MSRIAKLAAMTLVALLLVLANAPTSQAITGVVPNMFWRTCTWSCSPFVQSNGPYNPNVPSVCYTKNWLGQITSSYTINRGRC